MPCIKRDDEKENSKGRQHWRPFIPIPSTRDYCFFIGKTEPQYGQAADCFPVHLTSWVRIGPPHCGQVAGNKSARWRGSTGAGVTSVAGAEGGVGNFTGGRSWGGCGEESRNSEPNKMDNPIKIKIPGHQRPPRKKKANRNNQKRPPNGLHGRYILGPCRKCLCLCI